MGYKIYNEKGIMLAEFLFEHDRDVCLDCLREEHPDEKFSKEMS